MSRVIQKRTAYRRTLFEGAILRKMRFEIIFIHTMLFIAFLIILIPLLWLVSTSFKDIDDYSTNSASLIPSRISFVNYRYVFGSLRNFPIYMLNSFLLAFGVVFLRVFLASLSGYSFARIKWRFRDLIFLGIVLSMFIPRAGGLIALYELMTFLRLRNSLFGLILLFSSQLPAAIFIMRQSFLALPEALEDAALIDGATWFQVFWYIALPIASGSMLVVATLAFLGVWGDFLITFTMIDLDAQMTITVGIRKLVIIGYDTALSPLYRGRFAVEAANSALMLLAALPVVLFYAGTQRWFIRGLTEGALKF